jgi:hypothetical protein
MTKARRPLQQISCWFGCLRNVKVQAKITGSMNPTQ